MIKTVSGIASKNSFLMIDFVIDDEGDYENSMTGSDRRQEILKNIKESDRPVSGSKLAKDYDVSRQVIVQDIALLRASGYDIISTNRGYVLEGQTCAERVFKVRHTDEQLETELCTIVDLGGQVKNVMVNHKVYGHIEAELGITSRRKVKEFLEDIESGKSTPLKNITSDYHYHTVTADSEETLGLIEEELRKLGFLVEN
nr:transcription repressor NadR [Dorea formicigenerans]